MNVILPLQNFWSGDFYLAKIEEFYFAIDPEPSKWFTSVSRNLCPSENFISNSFIEWFCDWR
jgi:hypothetical protein